MGLDDYMSAKDGCDKTHPILRYLPFNNQFYTKTLYAHNVGINASTVSVSLIWVQSHHRHPPRVKKSCTFA